MKKFLLIMVLAALRLPCRSMTPKEYFEADFGAWILKDELWELYFDEDEKYLAALDSCNKEVIKYVYTEVLPTLESNSLKYANTLLRLGAFMNTDLASKRANAQKAKAIALAAEGKKEHYIWALEEEIESLNVDVSYEDNIHTYSADTLDALCDLYDQMLDCCHGLYRPTDSIYLAYIKDLGYISYYRDHWIEWEPTDVDVIYDRGTDYVQSSCRVAATLWRDLVRWDSISAEEYKILCEGKLLPFYTSPYDIDEEHWNYLLAASYFSFYAYTDYADIGCAHEQIIKRIYGVTSTEYRDAAEYCLKSLVYASTRSENDAVHYLKFAEKICETMLNDAHLPKDSAVFYRWKLYDIQCRMSLGDVNKKMQKEIEQTIEKVRSLQDTTYLLDEYRNVLLEHALLMGNGEYAVQKIAEEWKQMPMLPDINEDENAYYDIAYRQIEPCARALACGYAFMGDFDSAYQYLNVITSLLDERHYSYEDKEDIAEMLRIFCSFYRVDEYPYHRKLQKQFEEQLFIWCGYKYE